MSNSEQHSKTNNKRKAINSILTVASVQSLSPNFIRIVFNSEFALEVDQNWVVPHMKLIFPLDKQSPIEFPQFNEDNKVIWQEGMRERVRTYSIRDYDFATQQLTVDFAIHPEGVATLWAQQAQQGEQIGLLAMGAKLQFNTEQTLVLLGDITALPAISYTLEHLPAEQQAIALVELPTEQDKPQLKLPANVKIKWLITPSSQPSQLLESLPKLELTHYEQKLMVLGGMESSLAQPLRHYIKQHFADKAESIHIVSYWRKGLAEGQFKHSD